MKRIIYTFFLITFSLEVFTQDGQIQWQRVFEKSTAGSVLLTNNGYLITGDQYRLKPQLTSDSDGVIIKIDNLGDIQWEHYVGSTGFQHSYSVQKAALDGFAVLSITDEQAYDFTSDPIITRLNVNGEVLWENMYNDFYSFGAFDIENIYLEKFGAILNDGNGYLVVGSQKDSFFYSPDENTDFSLMKLATDGSLEWRKKIGGNKNDVAADIIRNEAGNYILAGTTSSNDGDVSGNHGGSDFWIAEVDELGVVLWQKCLGGSRDEKAHSIKKTSDGGYLVVGNTSSNDGDVLFNNGKVDIWVVKVDFLGNVEWQKSFGGSGDEYAHSVQITPDGDVLIGGHSDSKDGDVLGNHGGFDIWLVRLNGLGEIQSAKCFGGSNNDFIGNKDSFQLTGDGGYVFLGTTYSNDGDVVNNNFNYSMWLAKLDSKFLSTNSVEKLNEISIFPNPVNQILYFSEELKSITIHSISGQYIEQGRGLKEINLSSLSSGMYFLKAERENDQTLVFKFVKQ